MAYLKLVKMKCAACEYTKFENDDKEDFIELVPVVEINGFKTSVDIRENDKYLTWLYMCPECKTVRGS